MVGYRNEVRYESASAFCLAIREAVFSGHDLSGCAIGLRDPCLG